MITYRVDIRRTSDQPWIAQTRTGTKQRARDIAAFYEGRGFQVAVVKEGGSIKPAVKPREPGI